MLNSIEQLYTINVNYILSQKTFYNIFLKDIQKYFRDMRMDLQKRNLCFDFSNCDAIEGNVIPNLFATGYIMKCNIGMSPEMRLQPGSKLSAFLQGINFYVVNRQKGIFFLNPDTSDEKDIYRLAEYCKTTNFNEQLSEEQVAMEVVKNYSELFRLHLDEFVYLINDTETHKQIPVNIMEIFCKQLCYNSIKHGMSSCYVTMQVNKLLGHVLISFADYGKGMYKSFCEKKGEEGFNPLVLPNTSVISRQKQVILDLSAILECVLYRYNSIYGIWFVLIDVMRLNGIMRIHTGKVRIILSEIKEIDLIKCESRESALELIYSSLLNGEDKIQETPNYSGTHIEIELPLKKQR